MYISVFNKWKLKISYFTQYLEIKMERLIQKNQDGWDRMSQSSNESIQLVSIYKETAGRNILNSQYSLEPDMVNGWMPKLPSCPIPLTYQNKLTETILEKLHKQRKYQIVYRGMRCINSVQLHKKYNYTWKQRERYDVKVDVITQAVQKVGEMEVASKFDRIQDNQQERFRQISFDSNFQSGNLDLAVRIKKNEYDCFLRSDSNTKGHTNWYYFKVNNKKQTGPIQFNICNIVKRRNLYGKGMTPYTKIIRSNSAITNDWIQNKCYNVQFVERLCRYGTDNVSNHLQFKFDFQRENMDVYFAYSIPYTYTDLQAFIQGIKNHSVVKVGELTQSFGGLSLPLIILSKSQTSYSCRKKPNVIVTARIHPGQTNSSFMLQNFVRLLIENSEAASNLLSSCNFYIVPMMNPDGVVAGNYRTSFSGRDLNRKFDQIGSSLYPQINGLVDLIKKIKNQKRKIQFFFDFHSHSCKKDLFCYGPEHSESNPNYFRSRVLVRMMQKQDAMFCEEKCIYKISQHKKTTARAYMLTKECIPMTFTFEVSNGLYSLTKQIQSTYDVQSLNRAGNIIFQGLSAYSFYYLREYDHKSNVKKKQEMRLSLNFNKMASPQAKKAMILRRTLNLSSSMDIFTNNQQLKDIIDDIVLKKQQKQAIQQKLSDYESSQDDMKDEDIQNLFKLRDNYIPKLQKTRTDTCNKSEPKSLKISLKNITNQSSVKKIIKSKEKVEVILKKGRHSVSKSRIYYEQTHPPTLKKIYENNFSTKKAIKLKKFPILF